MIARQSILRSFLLSVLVVSALSSKFLHLFQHITSLPLTHFVVFSPTFFLQETLLAGAAWFLLQRTTGLRGILGTAIAAIISSVLNRIRRIINGLSFDTDSFNRLLTFILASSQISFYFETGSEVRWDAATTVGNDPEGRKLMLSGMRSFLGAAMIIFLVSWLCTPGIWQIINTWLTAVFSTSTAEKADEELPLTNLQRVLHKGQYVRLWTVFAVSMTVGLQLTRPGVPYSHMSGALPFTFFEALWLKHERDWPQEVEEHIFPFPQLLQEKFREAPREHYKGWAPGQSSSNRNTHGHPQWARVPLPQGFGRWTQSQNAQGKNKGKEDKPEQEKNYYDPVNDPLRITNLDHDVIEPVAEALRNHDIPITHVVLVMMESARKDVFPFKSGSHLHQEILSSHGTGNAMIEKTNSKLAQLTPIAEILTGEASGFSGSKNTSSGLWNDTAEPGMGGINVQGVLTGSSLSFKSAVTNYCGVGPLPVNFMEEVHGEIYQPCIMQIFNLFNQLRKDSIAGYWSHGKEHRNWHSVFLQSITGQYDDQDVLNEMMGFEQSVYREDIRNLGAKHWHPDMKEIHYFGYPEYEIYPYLKDVVNETLAKNERLFLSHFTSTTHHPWATPSDFKEEQYFAHGKLTEKHTDMNNYLNTVRYVDTWLGDMLKVLDEAGITDETLVVFVGDHGQAFHEDSSVSGTYENGHISNFRIPLVFRHPLLPKIQVTANATSMSVVPTILDLLVQTKSLNKMDSAAALDLINEYEGQSLIRPYQATRNGRQAWNFGIINAGGTMLSVGSAAVPYRLILPLTRDFEYVFSNLHTDPDELSPLREWSIGRLVKQVKKQHGDHAGQWVTEAAQVGRWWVRERKRLWNHEQSYIRTN